MEVQSEVINMLLGILGVIASIAGILVSFYLYKSQIKYERDRLKMDIVNMCMQISIDITKINKRFTDITNEYYTLLIDKIKEVTTDIIDNIDDKKITSGHLEEIDLLISMMQNNNINNKESIHTYLLTILNDYENLYNYIHHYIDKINYIDRNSNKLYNKAKSNTNDNIKMIRNLKNDLRCRCKSNVLLGDIISEINNLLVCSINTLDIIHINQALDTNLHININYIDTDMIAQSIENIKHKLNNSIED